VGSAVAASRSTLNFTDDRDFDIDQRALAISVGQVRASRWSFRASLGAILDGSLVGEGRTHNIAPGVVVGLSVAKQWTRGDWFLTGTYSLSVSRTTTGLTSEAQRETLIATDLVRVGVMAGRTFGPVSPYVLARGFGGPVFWRLDDMDVGGSDIYFFQLGAGATFTTRSGFSLVVDVSALGEQSASLGMAVRI